MLVAAVCPLSKAGFQPEKLLDAALLGFNEAPSTYNHHTVCVCVKGRTAVWRRSSSYCFRFQTCCSLMCVDFLLKTN